MTTPQYGPHILGARIALDDSGVAQKLSRLTSAFGFAVGGAGLAASIRSAIGEASNFETALTKVSTLLPRGEDAIQRYGKSVEDLAVKLGQSTDQVAEGLFQAISASVDATKAVEFLEVAGKAAVGGFTDLKTAVDGTTNILNAYGLASGEAQRVTDAMFIANRDGKTTFEELSRSIGNVAPTAAAAGLSMEEMLATVAAGTKVGLRTTTVVDSMRTALSALFKPSQEAAKLAQELGLRFDENSIKAYGLSGFLELLAQKTGGSTEKLSKLFGSVEAANLILTLTSEGGLASFRGALKGMNDDLQFTQVNYERAAATWDFKSRQMSEAIQRSFRAAGTVIIKEFGGDLDKITEKGGGLEKAVERITKNIVGYVRFAVENIEGLIKTVLIYRVGKMLTSFSTRMGKTAADAAAAAATAAGAAGAAGAGAAGAAGGGSLLTNIGRGFGLLGQGVAIASAVFYVTEAIIESQKSQIDFGSLGDQVGAAVNGAKHQLLQGGRGVPAALAGNLSWLGYGSVAAGLSPGGAAALAASQDPGSMLARLNISDSTQITKSRREAENKQRLDAFNEATGGSFGSLQEARKARFFMEKVLADRMPQIIASATRVTEHWTPLGDPHEHTRTLDPGVAVGGRSKYKVGDTTVTRTEALDPDLLATALVEAVSKAGPDAMRFMAQRDNDWAAFKEDLKTLYSENGGIIPAGEHVADVWGIMASDLQKIAETIAGRVETGIPVAVEIFHKIFDPKPKRGHGMSIQKRSAAKGLPPRYQALVVREGMGGLLVEPLAEDFVSPGVNDGSF